MLFFAWNTSKETSQERETKTRKGKKEARKEDSKKLTIEREREWKGEVRQAREKQRETLKNEQKYPLSQAKTDYFSKCKNTKKKTKKEKQGGSRPSEVALRATSPDP